MKYVYKYPIEVIDRPVVVLPRGAEVLCVQVQPGPDGISRPCLWVLVDPEEPHEERIFCMAGTGHALSDNPGRYVGTFQLQNGALVFHLFDPSAK